ncbi:Inorganic pyrophosphatase [Metarhizium rileyi]|uniref:inorganic diphosphatase n=1 Tax=Metarhizium rileyi (strain RCEF 4871) TaxID=1649241 RepID=A0A166ZGE9_METRR|nr:Inorganic pyrophosphatase [Metarhizium rileyi RCEF 4871]
MYAQRLLQMVLMPLDAIGAATDGIGPYTLREVGARNTVDWRIWLEKNGNPISPWHDVPLYPDNKPGAVINFVVEIPRWTDGKIETKRNEPLNPLCHDTSEDKPRFVTSFWPHKTYPFVYGSIPQTWENKNVKDDYTDFVGDNDPIDLFDVSSISTGYTGEVKQVKVLGGLAMIDSNTTDWKVIAIDVKDPLANLVSSVEDLDKYRPGISDSFREWFIYYKVARGSGLNPIVGNRYVDAGIMNARLAESHQHWRELVLGKEERGNINAWQTTDPSARDTYVEPQDATEKFKIPAKSRILPPAPKPTLYDRWYYLDDKFDLITVPGDAVEVA